MSLNSRCPCKYFTGTEFEKITDLKNIGLIIYRRGVKKLNDFTPIANIHNSTIALYNSKNINIISTDLTQEFERNKVSCPRCIHIVEYTQKLLQNVPVIGKKDTRAICDHCRRRSQLRTCQKCDETEKEFALFRKEQVINKREIELLLIRLLKSFENVLQNASTENESDDLYFHGREKDQEKRNGVDISKRHSTSYADISEIYNSKTASRISLRNNKSVQKFYSQINLEKRNKPHRSKESLIITRTKKTLTSSQAKDGENYQSSFLSSTGEVRRILQKETNSQLNETYSKNIKDVTKKRNLSFDKQRPTDVIDLKSNKIVKASNLKPDARITSTIKKEVEGDLGETLKEEMDTNRRDLQIERTDTKSKHNYESDLQRDDSTRRGKKVSGVTNYEVGKSNTEKGQKYSSKGVFQNIINHNSNPQISTAEHKPDNTKTKVKNAKEKPRIESRTSLVIDKLQSNIVRTKQNHITEKPKDIKNKNNLQISTAEHKPDNTKTKVINAKEKSRIESRTSLRMDEIQSNIRTKQNHITGKSEDINNKNNPQISTAKHKPDNTKTKSKEKPMIESRTSLGMDEIQSNIRTKQNHIIGKSGDIKNKNPQISTAEHKPDNTKTKEKEKPRTELRTSLGMDEIQSNIRTKQNHITGKFGDIKNKNNPKIGSTAEHKPDNTKTKAKEKSRIESRTSLGMDEIQSNIRTKQNHITGKSEDINNKNNPQISTAKHKPDNTKTKSKEKPRIESRTSLGMDEIQSNIRTKQNHIIGKSGDIKNKNPQISTAEHKPDNTKTKEKEKPRTELRTSLGMDEIQSNIRTKQNHITGKFGDIKNKNNPKIGSTAEHKPDNTKTKAKEKSRIESRTSLGMNELQKNKRTTQNLITEKTGDIKNINNPQITTAEHRPDKNTKTKFINAKEKLRIETSTSLRMDELQSNRRTKQNHITEKSEDIKNKNNPQISTAEHKPDNTKTKAINTKEKPRIQTSTSLGTYELQSNICTKQKHITELEIYKAGDIKNNNTTEKWISTKGESGLLKNDSIKNYHRKDLRYDNRLEQKQDEKDMNVNEKEVKEDSLNTIKKTYVTNNEFIRSRISKNTDRKELSESQKNLTPSTGNQKNTERKIGDKEKFKFQPKNSGSRKEETHDKFNGIPTDGTGIIKYALSDRQFIDKGWTLFPLEKISNKEIIYSMRPAHPELDWFEHNKAKGSMQYSTGQKLAEFDDNGHGRWYYKNGRLALDYSKDINGIPKIDIYSSGQSDQGHHSNPITVLATFDYNGNGVVFDHDGNVRLKYNQKTGVVLDRKIGPISRWKWHSLISLERRKCMMVETHLCDPNIMKLGDKNDYDYKKIEDEEMLKVELANDINKILKHEFILYQIQTKLFKINDHFSLRIMDQATIHIIFRDGLKQLKLNIGMILNNKDIIDIKTVELEQV